MVAESIGGQLVKTHAYVVTVWLALILVFLMVLELAQCVCMTYPRLIDDSKFSYALAH